MAQATGEIHVDHLGLVRQAGQLYTPNARGISPLHLLLSSRLYNVDAFDELLSTYEVPSISSFQSCVDSHGRTLLHWACYYRRDVRTLNLLCHLCSHPGVSDIYDSSGYTPLHTATRFASEDATRLLLDGVRGDTHGGEVVYLIKPADARLSTLPKKRRRCLPIHLAAQRSDASFVDMVYRHMRATASASQKSDAASGVKREASVNPLLERDSRGWTPLMHAIRHVRKAQLTMMLAADEEEEGGLPGVSIDVVHALVNAAASDGTTPLMLGEKKKMPAPYEPISILSGFVFQFSLLFV